ncbi:terminase family protein [Pseudoalteromonas sp. CnMc7-15]|uniref:terminase large subunit domain-containing protein n=1 Tax=unclassified Pseudoalteromonas TaxID=194690 RepID=UPI001EF61F8D|nr:terminase family protein [Pseudoalteromonas sp. CnMc7-15]MCG7565865.1 terminase family protein [Pseudoalteromonas sp. CnMc7-15]
MADDALLNSDAQLNKITGNLALALGTDILFKYQRDWIEDDAVVKIAEKSRRTGLTFAEALDDVMSAVAPTNAQNTYYLGSDKEMAKEFIDACAFWAQKLNMVMGEIEEGIFEDEDEDGTKKSINTFEVKFPSSGRKIVALSSNPRNLRGRQGNVVIDEAAFHDRLDEVLKAAMALTMWGGKVRIISTHNGVDNLFNTLITAARRGDKKYSVHHIPIDKALEHGLYKRICLVSGQRWSKEQEQQWLEAQVALYPTKEAANEELYCVPSQGAGQYLSRRLRSRAQSDECVVERFTAPDGFESWTEEQRVAEVNTWCEQTLDSLLSQLNPDLSHAFGEDFARSGDLTVFSIGEVNQDTSVNVPFMVELRNVTYEQQKQIMLYIATRLPRKRGMAFDATGNGGYLAEAAALKFGTELVDCVHLSQAWYREWMPKLKDYFETNTITLPKDQDVLDDLGHIKLKDGIPLVDKGKSTGSDGQKRHGDSAVSIAMLIRAVEMDGSAIEFTGLPSKHDEPDDNDDIDYEDLSAYQGAGCW